MTYQFVRFTGKGAGKGERTDKVDAKKKAYQHRYYLSVTKSKRLAQKTGREEAA